MRYLLGAVSVFCVLSIYSCREKPASTPAVLNRQLSLPTGTPGASPTLPGTNPVATNTASSTINPAHGQPGHRCDIAVGAPIPNTSAPATTPSSPIKANPAVQPASLPVATPASTASGLNPAHGQPGHRCDIAVGQPLNSKPANPSPTPATVTPGTAKPAVVTPDTFLAKGLNPAHGQPGHRCDVAVGKPLSEAKKTDPVLPLVPPTQAGN